MKKLLISLKSPSESLKEFKNTLNKTQKRSRAPNHGHYEIAFENRKDFLMFLKNIDILMAIQSIHPSSIYELAKIIGKDQSNVNKIITFFESYGIIKIKTSKNKNRTIKRPIVDYEKIEFSLKVA